VIEIVHSALPAPGRLFGGPRPDPPYPAALAALREGGVSTVVSLLGEGELPPALERAYGDAGLALLRYPIADFGVPENAAAFRSFLAAAGFTELTRTARGWDLDWVRK
jgi:hypothetical protein